MATRHKRGEGVVLMKTEVVRVRLTELEKEKLMRYAESVNMTMSDYIKYCCLVEPRQLRPKTRPLTDSPEDQELLADFLIREQDGEPPEQW